MAIGKNNIETFEKRILYVLKDHGRLPKSRIAYLTNMHIYDTEELLQSMLDQNKIKKIKGTIVFYDLVEKDGKKNKK